MNTDKNAPIILPLRISAVPMNHAIKWYKNALLLIQSQPMVMLLTSAWIIFIELFLSGLIPALGTVLFMLISPLLAFGMADLCQKIRLQEPASPFNVFSPFAHSIRTRLLSLGVLFGVILFGLFSIGQSFVDQTTINDILSKMVALQNLDNTDEMRSQSSAILQQVLHNKHVLYAFALMLAGSALAQILMMYAPLFAVWQDTEAPHALWISTRTVLINLLPIGATLALVALTVAALVGVIMLLGTLMPPAMMFVMMGAWIAFNALINGLIYTSYYDIIRHSMASSVQAGIEQIIEQEASQTNEALSNKSNEGDEIDESNDTSKPHQP